MRACLHAVEAEGAIEVSNLRREKERQLASAAQHPRRNGLVAASLDAINGSTRRARLRLPHLQFERRHRRCHEAELTDRAEVFTEGRSGEQQINRERKCEVAQYEPGRRAGQGPQIEELVGEEHRDKERDADPFHAKPARPSSRRCPQPPAVIPYEHERAARAEEVPRHEQRDDQPSAILHPREDRGEIGGCDLGTEEAVQDEDEGDEQQNELQRRPCVPPSQKTSNERPAQDVGRRGDRHTEAVTPCSQLHVHL